MNDNPINKGIISENLKGVGTVTRQMVHQRASELALISGRAGQRVQQADYEQAKRELTGESDIDQQEEKLNELPESMRWDPVPGSVGHETPGAESEDMDEEGRSDVEKLVEQGSEEASHDQMRQAAIESLEADRRDA